ncbi:MAG: hypothetical protein JNL39_11130 [Opitutaceae bacterium]|nr:hypothetical protein [Opitutaceae bacterium]
MRLSRLLPLLLLPAAVAAVIIFWRRDPIAIASTPPSASKNATVSRATPTAAGDATAPVDDVFARHAYARDWAGAGQPAAMTAFRDWTDRYLSANAAARASLAREGVALARARRPVLLDLIKTDPQRALAVTVPAAVRRELPAEVAAQLEARVAGKGELALLAASPAPGETLTGPRVRREVLLGGVSYTAHTYGRRETQTALQEASLHGITLDGHLALHESPLRAPESDEARSGGQHVAWIAGEAGAPGETAAQHPAPAEPTAGGCRACAALLESEAARRIAEEEGGAAPTTAAEPERPQSVGTKRVLVIRVDFSDFPNEPVAQATAASLVNGGVRQLMESMSYGKTSIDAVVTDQVYRMPQAGSAYATANNNTLLHSDARTAATPQYGPMSQFDRIIVVFPRLSAVSGSQITYGGLGQINSTNIWINGPGSFTLGTVTHELGHTYGLLHSNLWRVNDGNPASAAGNSQEYGDAFDTMGSGATRDQRHHFNPWQKNRLGWLPDSLVTTVTASGTYRIYRFDHRDALAAEQPLAVRVFRDGMRWYWVGYRQNFATGTPQANGAQIVWGYNNRQASHLLDLVTPGVSANDATLPIGSTFTDAASGVSIRAVARGGSDPTQYLDVEITLPPVPRDVVTAWGREGVEFYDDESGQPATPSPETFVPFNLTGVRAISAGHQHAVALKADGTVVAWGNNNNGQATVPAGLTGIVAVAAGGDVSGVVRGDGTVRLWGSGTSGVTTPPAGLADVTRLAIGANHALALKADGTVVAWGSNASGQTTVPAGLADVVAIAAGNGGSVALRRDGTVAAWGVANIRNAPAGLANIAAISAVGSTEAGGGTHVLALRRDGTVAAWGNNANGQTTIPAGLAGVVAIAAGGFHSIALRADGTIAAWGSAVSAQTNVPRSLPRSFAIAASSRSGLALAGTSVQFATQPQAQAIALGGDVSFNAAASGLGPVSYQWRKDGVGITGATAATLTLRGVTAAQAGVYDVVVTDALGSVVSAGGRLTIGAPVPEVARIGNLSIRTRAGTGAQTLIVGFVVGGAGTSGAKPLLVRGVGPALAAFGVGGTLADPRLEIYSGGTAPVRLFENDNWNAADAATMASVGAFALTAGSRDAALYNGSLDPAVYSAQLSGVGGTTGVALAEIYDVTPSLIFGAQVPRLINVSARTVSGTGADLLIAGFVISGPPGASKRVLIRAIGPTLAVFGVGGVLADPRLELFNSATVRIQENDNWGGGAELADTFRAVGAFGLDGASRDAALVATLPIGAYTAQVAGVGGGTGVALVEVYEVP